MVGFCCAVTILCSLQQQYCCTQKYKCYSMRAAVRICIKENVKMLQHAFQVKSIKQSSSGSIAVLLLLYRTYLI